MEGTQVTAPRLGHLASGTILFLVVSLLEHLVPGFRHCLSVPPCVHPIGSETSGFEREARWVLGRATCVLSPLDARLVLAAQSNSCT